MTAPVVVTEQTDLAALSDADLATATTEAPSPDVPAAGDQPTPPGTENPAATPAPSTDAPPAEKPAEGDKAAGNQPAPAPEDPLAALTKRVTDQESFIRRQAEEIGKLRKVAPPVDVEKIRSEIKERFFEDPIQATRDLQALEQVETHQKREQVLAAIPGFDELVDDMAEIAKDEGTAPEILAAFKRDPYRPPMDLLYNLAGRAQARKGDKAKQSELEKVKAELEAQKKKSEEVLKRIDAVAKGGSVLSTKIGGDSGDRGIESLEPEQIATLSDAQLKELLEKRK